MTLLMAFAPARKVEAITETLSRPEMENMVVASRRQIQNQMMDGGKEGKSGGSEGTWRLAGNRRLEEKSWDDLFWEVRWPHPRRQAAQKVCCRDRTHINSQPRRPVYPASRARARLGASITKLQSSLGACSA